MAEVESRPRLHRGLVVGQAPPGPSEKLPAGYQPLQGFPERRLAKLAGLESPKELWAVFDRIDLIGWCPGPKSRKDYHDVKKGYTKHNHDGHRFPLKLARLAAGRLLNFGSTFGGGTSLRDYAVVVLCGRHVAAAFGLALREVPWAEEHDGIRYLVMPHPSGVSHFWNDSVSRHRAAAAFRAVLEAAGLQPSKTFLPCASNTPTMKLAHSQKSLKRRRWGRGTLAAKVASRVQVDNIDQTALQSGSASVILDEVHSEAKASATQRLIHSRFFSDTQGD